MMQADEPITTTEQARQGGDAQIHTTFYTGAKRCRTAPMCGGIQPS
jgi:hypothetical protein